MIYALYTIHVLVCIFLILVVLLQQGKGADLSVFGGGSTQTAFGAVGATSLLHKLTVSSFVLFILTTMTIALVQGGPDGSSVLSGVMDEQREEILEADPTDDVVLGEDERPLTASESYDKLTGEGAPEEVEATDLEVDEDLEAREELGSVPYTAEEGDTPPDSQ